jgi:hypothetical protein
LKIDSFGNIIRVLHAKTILEKSDVAKLYPSMMIRSDVRPTIWPLLISLTRN